MKTRVYVIATVTVATVISLLAFDLRKVEPDRKKYAFVPPKGCVFRTIMGEESSANDSGHQTPAHVQRAVDRGLGWMMQAQQPNGGWGAGTHSRQDIRDPHAVATDPATTAMVAMAMLRSGVNLSGGIHSVNLRRALEHLLSAVENSADHSPTITPETGTQIQTKLGNNIDVILTAQFLSNMAGHVKSDMALKERIRRAQQVCIGKIQRAQQHDGSIAGSGWAGILQSSFATNALEAAEAQGIKVDKKALEQARQLQKDNYDTRTGNVNTDLGAGIVLYSVSGSVRASAKEAREAEEEVTKAQLEGKLAARAAPTAENLRKIGYDEGEALRLATAYEVYQSAKVEAQRDEVMSGFGNNGGEEFLSYLQTGESMMINKDQSWQQWYDNMSGRLLKIQNNDGSWQGHHCITSPVFCTATCLLILSVGNDAGTLAELGAN